MARRRSSHGDQRSVPENGEFRTREPERRQLTVMFCDLVDSTALAHQLDPEDLRDVIRLFQSTCGRIVERYEGYVSRYMGDAILVLFGYPAAHENEAERAVYAGLEISKAVSALKVPFGHELSLSVRTGIATGLVIAGDVIGEGASKEEAIVGQTPNLAARLQGLAEPNTVVVSDATRKLLQDAFECRSLGEHELKGFAQPVAAWHVVGPRPVETRFDATRSSRLAPLVDRTEEIELMWRLWERAKSRSPQILLLSGEAGIGKSRMARALRERIATEPHVSLQFQCSPYYRFTALYPFTRQLERAAGFERDDPAPVRLEKLRALVGEESLPVFARLMSVPAAQEPASPEPSPRRQREQTFTAIFQHLSALAEKTPVLAAFEDVQWMDPTSLELVSFMINRSTDASVLFLLTHRPEFSPAWVGKPNVSTLRLNGLARKDGEELAQSVIGKWRPSREVLRQLADRTEGVPLFIEELAKSLVDSGILRAKGGNTAGAGPVPPGIIPISLMDSLMARIDQLGDAKAVAQIGAVIGQEFTHSLLAEVAPLESPELTYALERLVSSGLAIPRAMAHDTRYVFKHALIRDAAYNSLLRKRREELHGRIAGCLEARFPETVANEPELVAYHYYRAGIAAKAIRYWRLAGGRASARSANLEALSHLTSALGLLESLPDAPARREEELSLLVALGPVQLALKGSGSEEAMHTYARAVELCAELPDSPRHFAAYWGQWRTSGNYQTRREQADRLLAVAENLDDRGLRLQAHHCQWASLFNLGFHRPCCQHVDRGLRLYRAGDFRAHATLYGGHDPAVCGHGEAALSLWLLGYPDKAAARIEQAHAVARDLSHAGSVAHAMDIALMLDFYRQDAATVYERATEMISLSAHEEFAVHRAKGEILRGWSRARLNDVDQGIVCLRAGLDMLRTLGSSEDLPLFLEMLAEACGTIGRAGEGLKLLDEAFAECDRVALRYWLADLSRCKGELLLASADGNEEQAERCFTEGLQIARRQEARSLELRTAVSYARLLHRRGESRAAYDLLSPVHEWFTEGFDSVDLAAARACLDELDGGARSR